MGPHLCLPVQTSVCCRERSVPATALEHSETKSLLSYRVRLPLKPIVPISRAALLSLLGSCYRQNMVKMVPLYSVTLPPYSGSRTLIDWANEQAEVGINDRPVNRVKERKTKDEFQFYPLPFVNPVSLQGTTHRF